MQVAVQVSTIIASIISVTLRGELSFFNGGLITSPHPSPTTLEHVLEVCDAIYASGSTSPAAALWPYYANQTAVDLFVVVTDEEENTAKNGRLFAKLFMQYRQDVNPSAMVYFVSFTHRTDNCAGQMVNSLQACGYDAPFFSFNMS